MVGLDFLPVLLSLLVPEASSATVATTVTLANGVKMPLVGAGTWQYNSSVAYESVIKALEIGYKHIDTAHDYENQDGVGRALKKFNRTSIFLTSKIPGCGVPSQGVSMFKCYEDTKKFFIEDLRLLDVEYVDLMLLHFPPILGCRLGCQAIRSQWKAMEEMYKAKKARAIGVSNYCQSCFKCLEKIATVTPMVNQFKYHVGMGADPIKLISYCRKNKIVPQAYSPLGNGSPDIIHGNITGTIGAHYNKSSVQIALKWIVQKEIPVLTKATNPKYLKDDIDLFDFEMSDDELTLLDSQEEPAGRPSFLCLS